MQQTKAVLLNSILNCLIAELIINCGLTEYSNVFFQTVNVHCTELGASFTFLGRDKKVCAVIRLGISSLCSSKFLTGT
jgi:hypothetical protein